MYILGICTISKYFTIAIYKNEQLIDAVSLIQSHASEHLIIIIEALFSKWKINYEDFNLFVTASGPGSFTGTRIGCALLLGIKTGLNNNAIFMSVNALDMYDQNIVIIETLNAQYYIKINNQLIVCSKIINIEDVFKKCGEFDFNAEQILLISEPYTFMGKTLIQADTVKVQSFFDATNIAKYGYQQYMNNNITPLKPIYMRSFNEH